MQYAVAGKEQEFLQKLVGVWDVEAENPEHQSSGWTETVRSLHGIWFVAEGHGEMPGGGAASTVMTLGYDPAKDKYVGTWIGSMMNHMWVYEGFVDETGKVLNLDTTGPDFEKEGETATYREAITLLDDDNRTFTSSIRTADGSWKEFMKAKYRRK
ncbi:MULTISPECIES: DUF1579 domain-containing protein [unclassified Sinorhizobium]|uniref:DUF1579 domain-containing protein n=1 Tax=unclassified Sinorhizobium TaxID=2613772 RepID=UPI0035264B60